ncbi:hypothetical protein CASFOL_025744 [Castilleja foliolosa]|uniref:Uncharacterized protein n=1 Tax=Castilleja foliolosa TaxID=1961234 RepID=A0ABD3CRZ3_9LAMI
MDFKGLSWAGNIYQKFETMCLEVEEVMYEDTVKYLENQAQKVGGSVKKFYSEVMQDLGSISCVDSVKVAESNKPKPVMLDSLEELRKKKTKKDDDIYVLAEEKSSSRFCNDANLSPFSDVGPTKSRKVGVYKRPIGIKRISQNNNPPEVTCHMTSLSRDTTNSRLMASDDMSMTSVKHHPVEAVNRPIGIKRISRNNNPPEVTSHMTSLSRDTTTGRLMASDDMSMTSSSEFPVKHHPLEAVNRPIDIKRTSRNNDPPEETCHVTSLPSETTSPLMASDDKSTTSSSEFPVKHHPVEEVNANIFDASDEILLAESVMEEKHDCEYVFLRQNKNGSQHPSSCHSLTTKPIDNFKNDGSLSHVNSDISSSNACDEDAATEKVISCYEDNFDMEIIDNEEAVDPRVAKLEPVENPKLEETCVLVQGDELHFVSQGTKKHKSYKKKMREALSSKLMSARKVIPDPTVESDKTKSPFHDSLESDDWELL